MSFEGQERAVLQLLRDFRAFHSPFGGATPIDSTLNLESAGSYGPAGLIFAGSEFDRSDRKLLRESFEDLNVALRRLRLEKSVGKHPNGDNISGVAAWTALVEPYLADPADPSIVDDLRSRVAKLDAENKQRQMLKPPKPPRVALVNVCRYLERHDVAVSWLAWALRGVDLYTIESRLMSSEEDKSIEN